MIKNEFSFQNVIKLKNNLPKKDFLIAGKGPTLNKWDYALNDEFNVIGINHVAEKYKTAIGHFTDYEPFSEQNWFSPNVIVSGMMNLNYKTTITLKNMIRDNVDFLNLYKESRLYTYDIITDKLTSHLFAMQKPLIFKYASGVLLIQIAILWGLKKIYTIGIDGGVDYHDEFKILKGNGLFLDQQISTMNSLAKNNGLEIIKI